MNVVHDPHEARIAVREATYPNRRAEDEAVRRVDDEVFARVKVLEKSMVDGARAHMERGERLAPQAVNVLADLQSRFLSAAERGEVTRELLREFKEARRAAEGLATSLEILDRGTEFHANRLRDVYGAYRALLTKNPSLRRGISI